MKRLFPLAALLCLPVLTVGCAPEDDVDDDIVAPGATDVDDDVDMLDTTDGDADLDGGADGTMAVESGSGVSMTEPAGDAVAAADFGGQVVFSVPDMTCPYSCAPAVKSTLAGLPGVLEVNTDVPSRTATIKVADGFDLAAAKKALAEKQFPVDNVL